MTAKRPLWVDTDAADDLVVSARSPPRRWAVVSTTSGACETPEAGAGRVDHMNDATSPTSRGAPAPRLICRLTDAQKMLLRSADRSLGAASGARRRRRRRVAAWRCGPPVASPDVAAVLASGRVVETAIAMGGDAPGREAEFNFACDPAAAAAVVKTCPSLTLVGLDCCTDAFAESTELPGVIGSLCSADACAARFDPLAAFCASRGGSFEIRDVSYGVDAAGRVVDGESRVRAATRLVDRGLLGVAHAARPLRANADDDPGLAVSVVYPGYRHARIGSPTARPSRRTREKETPVAACPRALPAGRAALTEREDGETR